MIKPRTLRRFAARHEQFAVGLALFMLMYCALMLLGAAERAGWL